MNETGKHAHTCNSSRRVIYSLNIIIIIIRMFRRNYNHTTSLISCTDVSVMLDEVWSLYPVIHQNTRDNGTTRSQGPNYSIEIKTLFLPHTWLVFIWECQSMNDPHVCIRMITVIVVCTHLYSLLTCLLAIVSQSVSLLHWRSTILVLIIAVYNRWMTIHETHYSIQWYEHETIHIGLTIFTDVSCIWIGWLHGDPPANM
jgi:hypothetical protein